MVIKREDLATTDFSGVTTGRRGISADTARRLGCFFGVEATFWMNLQARYDREALE